jgi:hypothetical protein
MAGFVGVNSPIAVIGLSFLKRQAIMFDKIAIPFLTKFINLFEESIVLKSRLPENCISELLWLQEEGLIFEPKIDLSKGCGINTNEYTYYSGLLDEQTDSIKKAMERSVFNNLDTLQQQENKLVELINNKEQNKEELSQYENMIFGGLVAFEYYQRLTSIQLRETSKMDAYPVLLLTMSQEQSSQIIKNEVLQIILNHLPIPDETVSWEQIMEYRSDPDSKHKFLDLRNWMNEVAKGELTLIEVEQKLEHLVSQYQRHMELHRMKTSAGTFETILVTGAEILEGLTHFQFSKAAKALFLLKHRRIALMEGELTSPGSEVAYVIKAKETFSNSEIP